MKALVTLLKKACIGYITLSLFLFNTIISNGQIRLTKFDTATDQVTIKNFGSSNVDISNYWFCARFAYSQLSSLTSSGSLDLAPDSEVVISGFSFNNTSSDVGLYSPINTNADFGDANFMLDFMQYGASGIGREGVANTAGIWTTGNFLVGTGPFFYNGNGTQNGVTFWDTTLSLNDEILNAALSIYPNPTNTVLNIKKLQHIDLNEAVIYDVTGRLLSAIDLTQTISEKTIALDKISKGIYFIRITDSQGGIIAKQFIKE